MQPKLLTRLNLKFRAIESCQLLQVSHCELTLFSWVKTKIMLDQNGLNPFNTKINVGQAELYTPLRKPYFIDIQRLMIEEKAPSMFIRARILSKSKEPSSAAATLLEVTNKEPFAIQVEPVLEGSLNSEGMSCCPYDSISLEILTINKDFHARQSPSQP